MQSVKGKGTKIEKRLFSLLVGMGLRGWKKNDENTAGKPDVTFIHQRAAVFVDGCFWHGCPYCRRKLPETNRKYWMKKIKRNVELAKSYNRQLRRDGWRIIRVWEHEIANTARIRARILNALESKGRQFEKRAD